MKNKNKKSKFIFLLLALALSLPGCLPKTPIAQIKDAENIRRTSDGRVFVTGGDGLFEIRRNESGNFDAIFIATAEQGCRYHAGLAQLHDWLFFVCARQTQFSPNELNFSDSGALLAYSLRDNCRMEASSLPDGCLVSVTDLSGYQFPNGLDALETEDAILLADEELLRGTGGISKLKLDFSAGVPVLVDYQHHWINANHGVYAGNAVRVVDGAIYLTDIGFFKRVKLNVDGSPSNAEILFRSATFLDDFDVACNGNGFLMADFVKGRLIYLPKNGTQAVMSPSGLSLPSAVLADPGTAFGADSVLVTERTGLRAGQGNQLVRIPRSQLGIDGC